VAKRSPAVGDRRDRVVAKAIAGRTPAPR